MKPEEVKNLTPDEIIRQEKMLREELFKLRFKHSIGQLSKTADIEKKKKDLARVLTIIKERKINE
jgi:large subunit ribosomal protein L29